MCPSSSAPIPALQEIYHQMLTQNRNAKTLRGGITTNMSAYLLVLSRMEAVARLARVRSSSPSDSYSFIPITRIRHLIMMS